MPTDDDSVHTAITKKKFKQLLAKCASPQRKMDEAKGEIGGYISDAIENDNAHKSALQKIRALQKMKAAKRSEFLFHFDTMRAYLEEPGEAWAQEDLPLGDHEAGGGDDDSAGDADEDKRDLRPRHLREATEPPPDGAKH